MSSFFGPNLDDLRRNNRQLATDLAKAQEQARMWKSLTDRHYVGNKRLLADLQTRNAENDVLTDENARLRRENKSLDDENEQLRMDYEELLQGKLL